MPDIGKSTSAAGAAAVDAVLASDEQQDESSSEDQDNHPADQEEEQEAVEHTRTARAERFFYANHYRHFETFREQLGLQHWDPATVKCGDLPLSWQANGLTWW
jgi:hypothetical protein